MDLIIFSHDNYKREDYNGPLISGVNIVNLKRSLYCLLYSGPKANALYTDISPSIHFN